MNGSLATSRVVSADGTAIADFRSGDGPPLILVHGTTADHTTFRVVAPRFAGRNTIHAIDRRGRGASGDGPVYAIEREYEDVAAVIDAVAAAAGGPADVVGHSFGGAVALGAATLTANLRRLVVYEGAPAVPGLSAVPTALVARLDGLLASGDHARLLRTFLREVVQMDDRKLAAFEASPFYRERLEAAPTVLRELTAGGPGADPARVAALAAAVRIPVLQLLGGDSPAFFGDATRRLDAALPDGRIVVLAGQRHAAHHDGADDFVDAVESFLDGRG